MRTQRSPAKEQQLTSTDSRNNKLGQAHYIGASPTGPFKKYDDRY